MKFPNLRDAKIKDSTRVPPEVSTRLKKRALDLYVDTCGSEGDPVAQRIYEDLVEAWLDSR